MANAQLHLLLYVPTASAAAASVTQAARTVLAAARRFHLLSLRAVEKLSDHAAESSAGEGNEGRNRRHNCFYVHGVDAPCVCIGHRLHDFP